VALFRNAMSEAITADTISAGCSGRGAGSSGCIQDGGCNTVDYTEES